MVTNIIKRHPKDIPMTIEEAIKNERERIRVLLNIIREHWCNRNGADSLSVAALDVIAEVIADGSYVERLPQ